MASITLVETSKLVIPEVVPANLVKEKIVFTMKSVTQGIANGVVRVAKGEMLSKHLTFTKYDTSDLYAKSDHIRMRLEAVRIRQDTPDNAKFTLDKYNVSVIPMHVFTTDIKWADAAAQPRAQLQDAPPISICNKMILLDLAPGTGVNIADIHVASSINEVAWIAKMRCIDKDFVPTFAYAGKDFEITIATNGETPIKQFIADCMVNIRDRLNAIKIIGGAALPSADTPFVFNAGKETHTIREIIFNMYGELYPSGDTMTTMIDDSGQCIIKLFDTSFEDATKKVNACIEHGSAIFSQLIEMWATA
jgi:hypothetical protein